MQKKANSIANVVQSSSILRDYLQKINKVNKLNDIVEPCLPEILRNNVEVTNFKKGRLVLGVQSPVWRYQLTFYKQEILQRLREIPGWSRLEDIEIAVLPKSLEQTDTKRAEIARKIPPAAREQIKTLSLNVTSENLKLALSKLSEH